MGSIRTTPRATPEPDKGGENEPSRAEIAASLSQKDPTWFRQTQERGTGSAAFRKNQVEETEEPPISRSMQLPGMGPSRELSKSPAPKSPQHVPSTRASAEVVQEEDRFKRGSTPDIAALRISMTQKPVKSTPVREDKVNSRPLSSESNDESAPSLARSSSIMMQTRPLSPVKGMGGFVESAMMKRSDSVSKRWSVREGGGLKRGDSVAGARPLSLHSRGMSRDLAATHDGSSSPRASSRPGSSHIESPNRTTVLGENPKSEDFSSEQGRKEDTPKTKAEIDTATPQTPNEDSLLARSPSKTMDPRRWSPTKSTWLESMLQQNAEPPKLQPLKEEQPKWKVDLQRSKSRASRDVPPSKPDKKDTLASRAEVSLPPPVSLANDIPVFPKLASASTPAPEPLQSSDADTPGADETAAVKHEEDEAKRDDPVVNPADSEESRSQETATPIQKPTPVLKPKPATPPKIDFRSNLKSRAPGPSTGNGNEPEFKSMFGKLKRTTTQNYVAPDEFKNNILSGKAALALTGGPVKTKRIDEFKESILAKKDEMTTAPPKPAQRPDQKDKIEMPVPEALARRKTLSKANAPEAARSRASQDDPLPKATQKPVLSPKLASTLKLETAPKARQSSSNVVAVKEAKAQSAQIEGKSETTTKAETTTDKGYSKPTVDHARLQVTEEPAKKATSAASQSKIIAQAEPTSNAPVDKPSAPDISEPREKAQSPVRTASSIASLPANSKLASRLNPNLAALLSRGSSPRPTASESDVEGAKETLSALKTVPTTATTTDDGLTHMTKGRAKGPRRRVPKAEGASLPKAQGQSAASESRSAANDGLKHDESSKGDSKESQGSTLAAKLSTFDGTVKNLKKESPATVKASISAYKTLAQPESPAKMPNLLATSVKQKTPETQTPKPKPVVANKSAELRRVSSNAGAIGKSNSSPDSVTAPKPAAENNARTSPLPPITMKPATSPVTLKDSSTPAAKQPLPQPSTAKDGRPTTTAAKPKPVVQGLGLKMTPSPKAERFAPNPRTLTPPPDTDIETQKHTEEARNVLESYLGPIEGGSDRADFDAAAFLTSAKPPQASAKTSQLIVHELSGDGKKRPIPLEQQHILYEDLMYLVVHKYSTESATGAAEVHLWCGDRVSDAAIQDVQIFCRRDAREHNAKLEVVKQGKESAIFIQAFGGILITRCSKSTASSYMLCGRRHLSHIVFDEVDLDARSLCPGYAFLVSAANSKLFLWKGKGAGADLIGSARLIGMDLGLTGEIVEVEQGAEPASFWNAVGGKKLSNWSSTWQERTDNTASAVLYRVEHERPGMLSNLTSWGLKRATSPSKQSVKANCQYLQPFSQGDLDVPSIHILDNYRTLYIIVTRNCLNKPAEFVTALYMAQDIAMLSPAIQDRPMVPACYVVAGDMPADVKACFRKWSLLEGNSLGGKDSLCVRLEDVMEALKL